jgi:hypothetical protein
LRAANAAARVILPAPARSVAPSTTASARPPLTEANLEALNSSSSAAAHCASPTTISGASAATNDLKTRQKLLAYNMCVDTPATIPDELQSHIETHITKVRAEDEQLSPYA